ncbi:MAG: YoaK family protein [Luteolibacter sp.]
MNTKRVVVFGGYGLAFGAAFANTGLLLHTGISVSHLTGDMARLTIGVARWSPEMLPDVIRVSTAAVCFFFGALLAGLLVHNPTLDFKRPYGRAITGIGILWLMASVFVGRFPVLGIAFSALGCGIQNALAAHYRGIMLRTTHLTGMFTDFGSMLGMRLRGHDIPMWKIMVPFLLIVSFFCGGVVSAVIQLHGLDSIRIAGAGYCVAGITWSVWKHGFPRRGSDATPASDR